MAVPDAHALAAARIDQYLFERSLRRESPGEEPPAPKRPVITISRSLGIPGEEIAARVASALGFLLMDRQVIEAIAANTGLGDKIIAALDEGSHSALDAWLRGLVDYGTPVVDVQCFHHMVGRAIRGVALHGSAVILGRGGNFILRDTDAFRVRLTAPQKLRIAALQEARPDGKPLSAAEARREVERHDEKRRQFIATCFRADIDDPCAYDAIFSLRRIDPEYAAGLILDSYRRAVGP